MQSENAELNETSSHAGNKKSSLIPCPSCDNAVAKSASACPHCGAENNYVHPKIASFLSKAGEMPGPAFRYTSTGMSVVGATEPASSQFATWGGAGVFLGGMLLAFTSFNTFGLLLFFVGMVLLGCALFVVPRDPQSFEIDYSSGKPVWTSTNDTLWASHKAHFLGH